MKRRIRRGGARRGADPRTAGHAAGRALGVDLEARPAGEKPNEGLNGMLCRRGGVRRSSAERGAGALRPCRAHGFLWRGLTWASARRTRSSPGYHIGGLQPRQGPTPQPIRRQWGDIGSRAEGRGQTIPESRSDFRSQDTDAELLMPRDCPEIRGGKGEG